MTESDPNPFDKLDLHLPDPLAPIKWIGHELLELFSMHQLASHGDHDFAANHTDEMLLTEDISGAGDGTWAE